MAGWKLVARALYDHGPGSVPEVEAHLGGTFDGRSALTQGAALGLFKHPGRGRGGNSRVHGKWTLTPLGVDWCEGRIQLTPARRTGSARPRMRFAATWLASLPRDIRILAYVSIP